MKSSDNGAAYSGRLGLLFVLLLSLPLVSAPAQDTATQTSARVEGTVHDAAGNPVMGASVLLTEEGVSSPAESQTNASGNFSFSAMPARTYTLKVEKRGYREVTEDSLSFSPGETKVCRFVLQTVGASSSHSPTGASPSAGVIELDDRPTFTIAGVSDSTGSGGHGSETRGRTGEVLARETLTLDSDKPKEGGKNGGINSNTRELEGALVRALRRSPQSFEANHRLGEFYFHSERCREAIPLLEAARHLNPADRPNAFDLAHAYKACGEFARAREHVNQMLAEETGLGKHDQANLRSLLGDFDERLEDPVGAVREYERAAGLDSSEQNYFAWGSELLLHGAAAPAVEVFGRGARLHPDSARMLAGLGAALYTSGSAEEAAQRLCEAVDLDTAGSAPYLFLGKMQEAASTPLPCAEQKLARFVHDQPANALANYYYALALWKRDRGASNSDTLQQAGALLEKASAIDPKLDVAYLQLGNLDLARAAFQEAIAAYQKAISANPVGSEAHYRLGLVYKRIGQDAKAQSEIDLYKQLEKTEAAKIGRQRRELGRFLFVLKDPAQKDQVPKEQSVMSPSVSK